MFANSDELLKYIKDEGVEMVDVRFCDLPGVMQHFTVPVSSFDQSVFDDGLNFDGSSIRGFQAIHESDMSLFPDPTTAYLDPFRVAKTLVVNFFIHDPLTGEAYSPRPAQHRPQGPGLPRLDRHRRPPRTSPPRRSSTCSTRVRFETKVERRRTTTSTPRPAPGTPAPRTTTAATRSATRAGTSRSRRTTTSATCATRWCIELENVRPHRRAAAPRGRHRRPGRDQLQLRRAAQGRRRRDAVQVHRQERRLAQQQDRDLHAEADLRRQRLGHALPPVASGTAASRCSTTRPGTPACPTWRATTSAASSSTPRRCWPSPTRR